MPWTFKALIVPATNLMLLALVVAIVSHSVSYGDATEQATTTTIQSNTILTAFMAQDDTTKANIQPQEQRSLHSRPSWAWWTMRPTRSEPKKSPVANKKANQETYSTAKAVTKDQGESSGISITTTAATVASAGSSLAGGKYDKESTGVAGARASAVKAKTDKKATGKESEKRSRKGRRKKLFPGKMIVTTNTTTTAKTKDKENDPDYTHHYKYPKTHSSKGSSKSSSKGSNKGMNYKGTTKTPTYTSDAKGLKITYNDTWTSNHTQVGPSKVSKQYNGSGKGSMMSKGGSKKFHLDIECIPLDDDYVFVSTSSKGKGKMMKKKKGKMVMMDKDKKMAKKKKKKDQSKRFLRRQPLDNQVSGGNQRTRKLQKMMNSSGKGSQMMMNGMSMSPSTKGSMGKTGKSSMGMMGKSSSDAAPVSSKLVLRYFSSSQKLCSRIHCK